MVSKNIEIGHCDRNAEILSYLYGESSADERTVLEAHLLDCAPCVDEFAAIAEARFAVYEWNQEEFSTIPTPAFTIPYEIPAEMAETFASRLSKIFSLTQFPAWRATAAAFATLTLLIGIGAYMFNGTGSVIDDLAANSNRGVPPIAAVPVTVAIPLATTASVEDPPAASSASSDRAAAVKVSSNQKARRSASPSRGNVERALSVQAKNNMRRSPSVAPTLSGDDEDFDDSLRLSDLFAEVDSLE